MYLQFTAHISIRLRASICAPGHRCLKWLVMVTSGCPWNTPAKQAVSTSQPLCPNALHLQQPALVVCSANRGIAFTPRNTTVINWLSITDAFVITGIVEGKMKRHCLGLCPFLECSMSLRTMMCWSQAQPNSEFSSFWTSMEQRRCACLLPLLLFSFFLLPLSSLE